MSHHRTHRTLLQKCSFCKSETHNKELIAENLAHIDFVKTCFDKESIAIQLQDTTKENSELKTMIKDKDQQLAELQTCNIEPQTNNSKSKILEKNKEISTLKVQINALEDKVGELQGTEREIKKKLGTTEADYEREKELNTLLMRNHREESTPKNNIKDKDKDKGDIFPALKINYSS